MKFFLFAISLIFALNTSSSAQQSTMTREQVKAMLNHKTTLDDIRKNYPRACHFYASIADFNNDNPIENMDWKPNSNTATNKITVIKNGKEEKVKCADLKEYFTADEHGYLTRIDDNGFYVVVVKGAFCYYIKYGYGGFNKLEDGTYNFHSSYDDKKYFDFFSETITGELKEYKAKYVEDKLTENGLIEEYNAEQVKREMKDSVDGFMSKKLNKQVKYLKLLNKKLKQKKAE